MTLKAIKDGSFPRCKVVFLFDLLAIRDRKTEFKKDV